MNNSRKAFHLEFHITKMLLLKKFQSYNSRHYCRFWYLSKREGRIQQKSHFLKLFPRDRKESWQVNISSVLHASLHLYKAARQGVLQEIFLPNLISIKRFSFVNPCEGNFSWKLLKFLDTIGMAVTILKVDLNHFQKYFFNREQPTRIYKLCLI